MACVGRIAHATGAAAPPEVLQRILLLAMLARFTVIFGVAVATLIPLPGATVKAPVRPFNAETPAVAEEAIVPGFIFLNVPAVWSQIKR